MKWMALEQLSVAEGKKRKYDEKTDVWSYGITSWEIFSKGKTYRCQVFVFRPVCDVELIESTLLIDYLHFLFSAVSNPREF